MNALSFITPSPDALDRAGTRLDAAAARLATLDNKPATGDDAMDEMLRNLAQDEFDRASKRYRALLEDRTGQAADIVFGRLAV